MIVEEGGVIDVQVGCTAAGESCPILREEESQSARFARSGTSPPRLEDR